MKDQPLISIIIPSYNRDDYISKTLNSVIDQTYENWECIIIDDGSQDNTIKIVQNYCNKNSRIKLFERDRLPKGANTCRNIGIDKAKGNYLIFLDSDDLLMDNCLENRQSLLSSDDSNLLITGTYKLKYHKKTKNYFGRVLNRQTDFLSHYLRFDFPWHTLSGTWRKDFIISLDGYDESLQRFQDPDLYIRALKRNDLKLNYQYHIPDSYYRVGHMQKLRQTSPHWKNVLATSYLSFYKKHFQNFANTRYEKDILIGIAKSITFLFEQSKLNGIKNPKVSMHYLENLKAEGIIHPKQFKRLKNYAKVDQKLPLYKGNYRINSLVVNLILKLI